MMKNDTATKRSGCTGCIELAKEVADLRREIEEMKAKILMYIDTEPRH